MRRKMELINDRLAGEKERAQISGLGAVVEKIMAPFSTSIQICISAVFLCANDELRVNIVGSQEKTSKEPLKLGDLAFVDVLNRTWMLTHVFRASSITGFKLQFISDVSSK